jgi:type IV pilus assembly protein PilM
MKPALFDEAIMRAVKKEISLSLDDLYVSWQLVPGQGEEQTYFVLGVPRNLIDALVATLKIAGIEPYLVDLRSLALARAACRKDAVIANIEPDSFNIIFVAGGMPAVIHTVNALREGATLEDNIRRLADELTKMAAFYRSRHPDSPLNQTTPLLLTGDLSVEAPTAGLLQSEVEYPVEMLAPPLDCPPELPIPLYMVNMGLALKTLPSKSAPAAAGCHDININLLSGKYRKPRAKPVRARKLALWILLAAAVALIYPLYLNLSHLKAENADLDAELSNITREYSLAGMIAEENACTENTILQIAAGTEALEAANFSLLAGRGVYHRDLRLVTGILPPLTSVTSIEIDGGFVTLSGETDSVFTVVDYAAALEQIEVFSGVRITELDENISLLPGDNSTPGAPAGPGRITFGIEIAKREQ